jgi:hypothetical protein
MIIIIVVLVLLLIGLSVYTFYYKECPTLECPVIECPKIECPIVECPKIECGDPNKTVSEENNNLKLLAKYLTILIRIKEAEEEMYQTQTGRRRVFHSPRLVQLKKQSLVFKQKIQNDPKALKFFNDNLDLLL